MVDLHQTASVISDSTDFPSKRTTDNLAAFLEHRSKSSKKLSTAPNEKGCPHTIIIAAAGQRAADLTRAVRKFQTKDCAVAKLFAKHIKLKEAIDTVSKTRMGIGVGTPQRLIDLLDDGASRIRRSIFFDPHR